MEYAISKQEYEKIRTLLYDESGISLGDSKQSLVVSRLTKRLRHLQLDGFASYYDYVTQDDSGEEFTRMLDLLSTNKTDFFREPKHFDFLRERILPSLEKDKQIRIWSSACSTGEEPYTIAMTLYESVRAPEQWNFQVLASDISTRVLAHAAKGLYAEERVREVPPEIIKRHFLHGRGDSAGLVKVTMTCRHDVKRVAIDPSLLGDDRDMLEDLVAAAFNDAVRRVETTTQEKMSGLTAGLPLPPGFKLPF